MLTGAGTLTVSGAVTVNPSTDSFLVPQLNGFLNLTSSAPTISVSGNTLAPLQVNLDIAGGLTLSAPASTPRGMAP